MQHRLSRKQAIGGALAHALEHLPEELQVLLERRTRLELQLERLAELTRNVSERVALIPVQQARELHERGGAGLVRPPHGGQRFVHTLGDGLRSAMCGDTC